MKHCEMQVNQNRSNTAGTFLHYGIDKLSRQEQGKCFSQGLLQKPDRGTKIRKS